MKHCLGAHLLGPGREEARNQFIDLIVEALRMLKYYVNGITPPPTQAMASGRPRKLITIFGEKSTRTKESFEEAFRHVGFTIGSSITGIDSSLGKGESLLNTLRMAVQYGATAVVIRDKTEGIETHLAQALASSKSGDTWVRKDVSIIIGGAGRKVHFSQVALDAVTIVLRGLDVRSPRQYDVIEDLIADKGENYLREEVARILDNLRIAFVGDLAHSRIVHDWLDMLKWFDITLVLIAPKIFSLEAQLLGEISDRVTPSENLGDALDSYYVYAIRMQIERLEKTIPPHEARAIARKYQITPGFLESFKGEVLDAQPLDSASPMVEPGIWQHPKVIALMQSAMGVPTRMAIARICDAGRNEDVSILTKPTYRLRAGDILREEGFEENWQRVMKKHLEDPGFVTQVRSGVVVDRIIPGRAKIIDNIFRRAGVYRGDSGPNLVGTNFLSASMGKKDVIFLHNTRVPQWLLGVCAVVSPGARVSVMRDDDEEKGYRRVQPSPPKMIAGVFRCPNEFCVTNVDPEAETFFWLPESDHEVHLKCAYCRDYFSVVSVIAEFGQ